eukprot:166038-Amphidinium_carterae.1
MHRCCDGRQRDALPGKHHLQSWRIWAGSHSCWSRATIFPTIELAGGNWNTLMAAIGWAELGSLPRCVPRADSLPQQSSTAWAYSTSCSSTELVSRVLPSALLEQTRQP